MTKKEETKKPAYVAGSLRERAMLVRFATGRWYGRGADEAVVSDLKKKHDATGDVGTFTKRFMERHRMAAIDAAVNDARKVHRRMTVAWGDMGVRVIRSETYFEYKQEMTACEMRFHAAVKEFIARFDELVAAEEERLKTFFKRSDYPTREELEQRYYWRLVVEPIPDAEDFRIDLGADEMKRIKSEMESEVRESLNEASRDVWSRLYEVVERVSERMKDSDAQVRESLFEHVSELVTMLPKLNISDDPKLTAMGEAITKELLDGHDVGALKESSKARSDVATKADKLLKSMASFTGRK